jgi:hypothetical protein
MWKILNRRLENHYRIPSQSKDESVLKFLSDLEVQHQQTSLGKLLEAALQRSEQGKIEFEDCGHYFLMKQQQQLSLRISLDSSGAGTVILMSRRQKVSFLIRKDNTEWAPFLALHRWCGHHALSVMTVSDA